MAAISVAAARSIERPNYRYSVIPGGAHSREELLDTLRHDPVVATHYAALSRELVREERLPAARRAYVSYRVGDRIYWTKEKVTLPAGEQILTDGVIQIRARCGNCIALEPQLPTSEDEPAAVEFDALTPPAGDVVASLSAAPLPSVRTPLMLPVTSVGTPGHSPGSTELMPLVPTGTDPSDRWRFVVTEPGLSAVATQEPAIPAAVPNLLLPIPLPGRDGPDGSAPGGLTPGTASPPDILSPPDDGGEVGPDLWDEPVPAQPVPVPEPSTIVLLGTGAAGMVWRRLRSGRTR